MGARRPPNTSTGSGATGRTRHLHREQRIAILGRLRDARALLLRDAESFHEAAIVLEYIGQLVCQCIRNGLAQYEAEIVWLACTVPGVDAATVRRQFHVVREARNDAVHGGAFARHLSVRLDELLMLMEEAVMYELSVVGDVMVRNPVVAEPWHLLEHFRREMLANSFSNLPLALPADGGSKWVFLCDTALMHFLLHPDRVVAQLAA